MKTCLVSGGSGFIGSGLCESLLEEYKVRCLDDLSSGRRENVSHLEDRGDFEFIEHNVIEPIDMGGIDFVFHLASRASPIDYQSFPIHTLLTNTQGTYNLLEVARKNQARFLFASTSEVYGDPLEHPQKESYWGNVNPNGIRSCYDEAKRCGEALVRSFQEKYHLDARTARIFNTYGPQMKADDGRVVSNFVNQALNNQPLTIYGNGSQSRSFCYVSDMVEGLKRMMFIEKTRGEVINLGNPDEFTVRELAEKIKRLTDSHSEVVFRKLPEDDPKKRKPDIGKAREILQWQPQINLEEGLKRTIRYFKEK